MKGLATTLQVAAEVLEGYLSYRGNPPEKRGAYTPSHTLHNEVPKPRRGTHINVQLLQPAVSTGEMESVRDTGTLPKGQCTKFN